MTKPREVGQQGFFDFLADNPRYAGKRLNLNRLNQRHEFLVEPYAAELAGAKVLDLASHDGRWSYALSAAGAASVLGIEARADQIEQFAAYPDGETKSRVTLVHGDVYDELPKLVARGDTFDVVAMFGFFYHVMDHYGLLKLVKQLAPGLVVIDSEFHLAPEATIRLAVEPTDSPLNSIAHEPDQKIVPVGIPSRAGAEVMAARSATRRVGRLGRLPRRRRAG